MQVSIHAPAWGATGTYLHLGLGGLFRSTLPRGERRGGWCAGQRTPCFDPRSRVGSDVRRGRRDRRGAVSIHAPAWGATERLFAALVIDRVSIHAPAWGATGIGCGSTSSRRFRSTLPRGERRPRWLRERACRSFDPRSRVGSDPASGQTPCPRCCFDPRSRVGSDILRASSGSESTGFDPRSRVGSDMTDAPLAPALRVSIHAPAWGATSRLKPARRSILFRSTLPRGERRADCLGSPLNAGFDPRSRVGSDGDPGDLVRDIGVSIHAPARGAT